jgi:hypothetical protein
MIPVENEVEIMWCSGRDRVRAKLLIKETERPLQSNVFLGSRDPIASDTSDKVTGSREKLNKDSSGIGCTGTSGGRSVGTIVWAIVEATLVKNILN